MTEPTASTRTRMPRTDVVLARLAAVPAERQVVIQEPLDDITTRAFAQIVEQGWATKRYLPGGYTTYDLNPHGRRNLADPAAGLSAADLVDGDLPAAQRALWGWLLTNGGRIATYDGGPMLSTHAWHLLACGLDTARSSAVRDATWLDWGTAGSDATGEQRQGLAGDAVCNCGKVNDTFIAQVDSLTDLLLRSLPY